MIRHAARLTIGCSILALSQLPAAALAQDTQDTTPAPAAASPQSAQASSPTSAAMAGDGLSEIVVTATRRETNLQKTPISISVLSTQALADRHVLSLINLGDGTVPSLRVATFEARQSALTIGIRGIVPYDQNQTARDAGVGVYIDGIAIGKTQGLNTALFDIERIEVLKGPQGTLFGRNTEGGALSLVTRAPSGEFDGRVSGGVGNYKSRYGEIHLDLPSFYNIAIKLDGVYQHQGPTVKDPLEGSVGFNAYDRKGGRVAARWTPIEGFTADFAYDQARDDNTPFYSQLLNYNPNKYNVGTYAPTSATNLTPVLYYNGTRCNVAVSATGGVTNPCIAPLAPLVGVHPGRQYVADVGVPQQYSVDRTHGTSATLKYKAADWIELRSITAWRGVDTDQYDNSGGPERVPFSPSFPGEDITTSNSGKFSRYSLSFLTHRQFSQEFQAVGSIPQFDYVAGLYYYTEHDTEYAATPTTNLWNATGTAYTLLGAVPPATNLAGAPATIKSTNQGYQAYDPSCNNTLISNFCRFITRDSQAHDHNYGVFGQVTYTPDGLEALHITAGGRYTNDRRRGTLFIVNGIATNFAFRVTTSRFDPMFNVAYDVTNDVHVYAKYSTGFRSGGANDRSQQFNAFGPESVRSYEVGAKMDFLDHKARLNLAGYIMNRKNTQFDFDVYDTDPTSPTYNAHIEQTQNVNGTTKIRGVEADLTLRPFPELTLTGSYAYTYWRVPPAPNPLNGGILQTIYLVYTPKNAASVAGDYVRPIGSGDVTVRLHLDAAYASSQYSFQTESTKTDDSFIVNGRLALADIPLGTGGQKLTVAAWVRNLLNEEHIYRRSAANSSPVYNYNAAGAIASTSYGGILGDYGNYNPPRTFGIEGTVRF
jgi:iron complex outermembrane receptor protein